MLMKLALKVANKLMQTIWRWTRGLTLGVQCCLIDEDGKVLLVRHGYRPGWHFPGGGVEKNETVRDALERELLEEVNVTLSQDPDLIAPFANFKHFPGDHILLYVCRHWSQLSVPDPSFEIAEIGRFAPDALPTDTHPPTRARIEEIFKEDRPAAHWHVS